MLIKKTIDKLRKNNSDSKHKDAQQPGELIDKRQDRLKKKKKKKKKRKYGEGVKGWSLTT